MLDNNIIWSGSRYGFRAALIWLVAECIMKLPDSKYQIIYADPPWDYKGQKQHCKVKDTGGAISHYGTMTVDEMKKNIVLPADTNCLLFMWTSSPHLNQAIDLGEHWGFKYATVAFVWDKQMVNPGFYTMSQCELCLVFKKGKIPSPRGSRSVRQLCSEKRREHSRKPCEIRDRIHEMFPTQQKIELFAREKVEGWDCWGNEVDKYNT